MCVVFIVSLPKPFLKPEKRSRGPRKQGCSAPRHAGVWNGKHCPIEELRLPGQVRTSVEADRGWLTLEGPSPNRIRAWEYPTALLQATGNIGRPACFRAKGEMSQWPAPQADERCSLLHLATVFLGGQRLPFAEMLSIRNGHKGSTPTESMSGFRAPALRR